MEAAPELNIMPFIDIFSMLNTFLLVSAAFINIGLLEVQVPFMTNAPPPKDKPPRSLTINVAVEAEKVILETSWDAPPEDEQKKEYGLSESDLTQLHKELVALRSKHPEFDTINLYSDDEVKYNTIVQVLDVIKVRRDGDPEFKDSEAMKDENIIDLNAGKFIYRKVVMAGVII